MAVILCLTMLCFFPLCFGMLNEKIWKKTLTEWSMTVLSGLLLFFVLFEMLGIIGIKMGLSFLTVTYLFLGICVGVAIILLWLSRESLISFLKKKKSDTFPGWRVLVLLGIGALLISYVFVYTPTGYKDVYLETVMTTTNTETIFSYHPLTGQIFGNGMYPITKLSLISIFYASMSVITGMEPAQLLYKVVPIGLLAGEGVLLYLCSGAFFREKKERQGALIWFGILFLLVEKKPWCFTYRILAEGYQGNTIWMLLVLPFTIFWIVKLWETGKKKMVPLMFALLVFGLATLFLVNTTTIINDVMQTLGHNLGKESGYYILVLLYIIWKKSQGDETGNGKYVIVFFILCFLLGMWIPLVAVALSDVLNKGLRPLRIRATAGILLLIFLTGPMELYPDQISPWFLKEGEENQEVNELIQELKILALQSEKEHILVAPVEIIQEVRKEVPEMILPYGKDYWITGINKEVGDIYPAESFALYASMLEVEKYPEKTLTLAENQGCSVFVSPISFDKIMENKSNWSLYKEVSGYFIYCR